MTSLSSSFEEDLRDAMLAEAERELVGKQASLVYELVELVHTQLRAYGQRHGYDVESTIESLGQPTVDRSAGTVTVSIGWQSKQMARWEFGTSDHTVRGDPLSFIWYDPPQWVREEFDQARDTGGRFASGWRVFLSETDVDGLPESRAIRDSLRAFRQVIDT
jgi:hypothetical protein